MYNSKILTGVYIGLAILAVFIVYKILTGTGLIITTDAKIENAKGEKINSIDFFNPMKNQGAIFKRMGENQAKAKAVQIYKASNIFQWGVPTTISIPDILSIIGSLENKYQLSELAEQYYKLYDQDLRADVTYHMNDSQKAQLFDIIDNLPLQ